MKKLMMIAVAMMAAMNASAQIEEGEWYVTPKAGFSVADLTGKLYDPSKAEVGFTAGVDFMYACNDNLGVSFGLNYARQGAKTEDDLFRVSMDYINVPLTLNYYPFAKVGLALKAGIQVGFLMHKKKKSNGIEYNSEFERTGRTVIYTRTGRPFVYNRYVEAEWSRNFNKVDCSIPLAISYELFNFQLEARYNLGLVKVMKDDDEASKNRVWQFTLGYKFDLGE